MAYGSVGAGAFAGAAVSGGQFAFWYSVFAVAAV